MKKRILSVILAIMMIAAMVPMAFAEDVIEASQDFNLIITADGIITGFEGVVPADLTIPAEVDGIEVFAIGDSAFENCSTLESLTIRGGKCIYPRAFMDCVNLTNLDLYADIETISADAFRRCSSLRFAYLSDTVEYIGERAFSECKSLEKIDIPESVKIIDMWAFYACLALEEVDFSEGLQVIGSEAFAICRNLKNVTIPSSVLEIEIAAFWDCSSLKGAVILGKETVILEQAFQTQGFEDIDNITVIYGKEDSTAQAYAEENGIYFNSGFDFQLEDGEVTGIIGFCPSSLIIPEEIDGVKITSIGAFALSGLNELEYLEIPDTVTRIGVGAISGCRNLKEIIMPKAMECLDMEIFYGCDSLERITIPGCIETPEHGAFYGVGPSSFRYCENLKEVYISDGVKTISNHAFACCDSLESILIPESVKSIGWNAFGSCKNLKSVIILNDEADISWDAFGRSPNLTIYGKADSTAQKYAEEEGIPFKEFGFLVELDAVSGFVGTIPEQITIPSKIDGVDITCVAGSAFENCEELKKVVVPEGVTSIGVSAFASCTNLEEVVLPESVTEIWDSAFSGCLKLKSINIPDNVIFIGDYAFTNCTSLTSVIIPDGVSSIGENAFSFCTNLSSIEISDNVEFIGDYAFAYCGALASVNIPNKITNIGTGVFANCGSLTNVDIPSGIETIGTQAFYGCSSLERVNFLGNKVTNIGDYAFYSCENVTFYGRSDATYLKEYAKDNNISFVDVSGNSCIVRFFAGSTDISKAKYLEGYDILVPYGQDLASYADDAMDAVEREEYGSFIFKWLYYPTGRWLDASKNEINTITTTDGVVDVYAEYRFILADIIELIFGIVL